MSYLVPLKTMLVDAIKQTFDQNYPEPDFRGLHVSIEYPIDKMAYPSIWVDFQDTGSLQIAGINHREFSQPGEGGVVRRYTRWRFSGYAQFTVVALTSLQRDRLYDELVRVCAFGRGTDADPVNTFRNVVEDNEFIACNFDFDQIEPTGNSAAPGTPWGSDEIIYERSLNMEVIGEFVSDGTTLNLASLSQVIFDPMVETAMDGYTDSYPGYTGHPDYSPDDPGAWQ
jgi:hypothetical protein